MSGVLPVMSDDDDSHSISSTFSEGMELRNHKVLPAVGIDDDDLESIGWSTPTKRQTRKAGSTGPQGSVQPLDECERSPKTDYTYARSAAYSTRFLGKHVASPNMCRTPLYHETLTPPIHKAKRAVNFQRAKLNDSNITISELWGPDHAPVLAPLSPQHPSATIPKAPNVSIIKQWWTSFRQKSTHFYSSASLFTSSIISTIHSNISVNSTHIHRTIIPSTSKRDCWWLLPFFLVLMLSTLLATPMMSIVSTTVMPTIMSILAGNSTNYTLGTHTIIREYIKEVACKAPIELDFLSKRLDSVETSITDLKHRSDELQLRQETPIIVTQQQTDDAASAHASATYEADIQNLRSYTEALVARLENGERGSSAHMAEIHERISALERDLAALSDSTQKDYEILNTRIDEAMRTLTAEMRETAADRAEQAKTELNRLFEARFSDILSSTRSDGSVLESRIMEHVTAFRSDMQTTLSGLEQQQRFEPVATDVPQQVSSEELVALVLQTLQTLIVSPNDSSSSWLRAAVRDVALETTKREIDAYAETTKTRDVESAPSPIPIFTDDGRIKALISEALALYDADKTGLPDFALESGGGSVVSVRCSETYTRKTAQFSIFGIPLWYASNSPRTVIQALGMLPGQCWAFHKDKGFLVIQLSRPIIVRSVSVEHIPRSISPTEKLLSAPREFGVFALTSEKDMAGKLLGNFTYDAIDGDPVQTFPLANVDESDFSRLIEFRFYSNHGHPEYTCLYRLRVHGTP